MEDIKRLVQVAGKVQEALTRLKHSRYLELMRRLMTSVGQLQELTAESRKMRISVTHGWFSAAGRCCSRTSRLLGDISYSISQVKQFTESPQKKTPKLSLLVAELNQLEEEFGSVDFDNSENAISVVTDPITLDDVPLGPFKIQLGLGKLGDLYKDRPYLVIALNPNPAATDDGVTHPHVTGQKLCEGDGAAAITASLEQGRLSDFFTMVRSILNTYNPDSPYVALHEWDGEPCYECGYVMSSDNSYYCSFCERDFCEECTTCCRSCDETVCLGCASQCGYCEETVCPECITECPECGSLCCKSCLEDSTCPNCKQEKETEENGKQQENQERTDKQNENKDQSETTETAIKLAS